MCNEAEGDLNISLPHPGDFLTEFFKLCCRKETTEDVLGRGAAEDEGKGQSHHLSNEHEVHHGSMLKLSKQSLPGVPPPVLIGQFQACETNMGGVLILGLFRFLNTLRIEACRWKERQKAEIL